MRIRQKYGLIALLLLAISTFVALGQNQWEGTAVVGRYGEFPPGGLYAASNTFPLNSMITVTNTQNGKSARLIVVRRIDDPGIFLLLSESAAYELDVTSGIATNVRVSPVNLPGLTSVDPNKDLPFHPDPDVNPAASVGDPNASIIRPADESAVTSAPSRESEAEEADTVEEPETVEEPKVAEGPEDTEEPEVVEEPAEAEVVAEASESPEVPLPPASSETTDLESVTLVIPPEPEEPAAPDVSTAEDEDVARVEETGEAAPEQPDEPVTPPSPPNPVRVVVELPPVDEEPEPERPLPPYRPQEVGPGEIALPLQPLSDAGEPIRPSKVPENAIVSLEPAEPRYPEPDEAADEIVEEEITGEEGASAPATPDEAAAVADEDTEEEEAEGSAVAEGETPEQAVRTAEAEAEVEEKGLPEDDRSWARANLPLISTLTAGSSYVQVAAFTNPRSAKSTVDQLGQRFPVAVLPQETEEREIYRIFVGPLSEDEKGSALYSVRRRGFRDAFVRDQR